MLKLNIDHLAKNPLIFMMYNIYIIYGSSLQIQAARLSALAQIFCRTACAAAQSLSRIIEVNVSNFAWFLFPRIVYF